ncbi:hypothetical protein NST63_08535 [Heyndrickxia sp. FSL W8-0496]|uniref:hypothetical protein n=1 Tax=Heyndrickxia TaxID=2837504 RepID=UPI0030FA04FF
MVKLGSNLLILYLIVLLGTNVETVNAVSKSEIKPPKKVCIEEFEIIMKEFNEKVLRDIVESFELDLSGYREYTFDDLDLDLKLGEHIKNQYDKISLQQLFVGASNGSRRLFLKNGIEGTKGYFLYKRIDGNNVIKELEKKGNIWVVMYEEEKKASRIIPKSFNWNKCAKE